MAGCVWILQGIVAVGLWASAVTGERHALIILLGNDADGSADDAVAVRGAAHDAAVLANMFLNRRDDFSTRTVIAHRQYAQLLRGRCGGVVEMTGVTTFASLGRGWSQGCYVVVFVMGHVALHRDRRIAVGESLLSPDDFLEVLTSRPFGRMLLFLDTWGLRNCSNFVSCSLSCHQQKHWVQRHPGSAEPASLHSSSQSNGKDGCRVSLGRRMRT